MPIVVNATQETISVKVAGNYFTFKPGSAKTMRPEIANFIELDKKGCGLAVLPDIYAEGEEVGDVSEDDLAKRKAHHEELKKAACSAALDAYIQRLRSVIYNNQVSLKQDLAKQNIQASADVFASNGELEAMRIVASYQRKQADAEDLKKKEVQELMKKIKIGND